MTKKYTKKPVVVEAIQFTGLDGDVLSPKTVDFFSGGAADAANPGEKNTLLVSAPNGNKTARVGDYIIKNADGEFNVVKAYKFYQDYQPARIISEF